MPHPTGRELSQGFSPQLSWSHYRALMRVGKREAGDFYERGAIVGGWDKRMIQSVTGCVTEMPLSPLVFGWKYPTPILIPPNSRVLKIRSVLTILL